MNARRVMPLVLVVAVASLVARLDSVTAAEQPTAARLESVPARQTSVPAQGGAKTRMAAVLDSDLAVRRQQVDDRLREIEMRERLLAAAENRLRKAATEAPKGQAAMAQPDRAPVADRDDNHRVVALVKLYQAMQPRAAARIFERLDENVQTAVALNMRERSMAAIMAEMTPEAATRLTMALARRPETLRPTRL